MLARAGFRVAVAGRPSHAYLLHGPAGSGKTTTVVGKVLWLLGLDPGAIHERKAAAASLPIIASE